MYLKVITLSNGKYCREERIVEKANVDSFYREINKFISAFKLLDLFNLMGRHAMCKSGG